MAGIAIGALAACGLVGEKTYEDDSTLSGKITSIRLDIGSGGVTVNGVPGGGSFSLHRKIDYRGDKPRGATHRIENGVLILGGCGSRCSVDYTVDVPAGIPVGGEASSGSVRLARVGAVKVTTSTGDIEMNGVTGTVEARTSNGEITGKGMKSDRIEARTSNGSISLTPDTPADVHAKTSNGAVTLAMPRAGYRVSAETDNGGKHIDVPDDPSGRYGLAVETGNGDITVKNG